jgi:hypothetical protein
MSSRHAEKDPAWRAPDLRPDPDVVASEWATSMLWSRGDRRGSRSEPHRGKGLGTADRGGIIACVCCADGTGFEVNSALEIDDLLTSLHDEGLVTAPPGSNHAGREHAPRPPWDCPA